MMRDGQIYRDLEAPGAEVIEALAAETLAQMPEPFRSWVKDVVVKIEDFPSDEIIDEMGLESAFELLGLYQGVAIGEKTSDHLSGLPDMIFLYRRPMLDYWSEHHETLAAVVRHVLIHEIGHHFGLSDDDMERIETMMEDGAPAAVH
ncbi:MAG: metallopeptidase family protein [Pseudomonadota bacterium]